MRRLRFSMIGMSTSAASTRGDRPDPGGGSAAIAMDYDLNTGLGRASIG